MMPQTSDIAAGLVWCSSGLVLVWSGTVLVWSAAGVGGAGDWQVNTTQHSNRQPGSDCGWLGAGRWVGPAG